MSSLPKVSNNDLSLNLTQNNTTFTNAEKSTYQMNVQGVINRGKMFEGIDNEISFQRSYRNQQLSKQYAEADQQQDIIDEFDYEYFQQQSNTSARQMNMLTQLDALSFAKGQSNFMNQSSTDQNGNTIYSNTNRESHNLLLLNNPQQNNENSPHQSQSYLKKQIAWLNERISQKIEESPLRQAKGRSSFLQTEKRGSSKRDLYSQAYIATKRDINDSNNNVIFPKSDIFNENYKDEILSSQKMNKDALASDRIRELDETNTIGIKNYLIILSFLQKFVMTLIRKIAYKNPKYLSKMHLNLIGDKANENSNFMMRQKQIKKSQHFENTLFDTQNDKQCRGGSNSQTLVPPKRNKKKKSFQLQIGDFAENIKDKLEIFVKNFFQGKAFKPDNALIICLNLILLFQLVSHIIIIPIKICFFISAQDKSQFLAFYTVAVVCLIIEIVIGFQTGFYESGVLVLDRIKIARSYIQFQFWIEFCSIILIAISSIKQVSIIEAIIVILRFNQVIINDNKQQNIFQLLYIIQKILIKIGRLDEHFELSSKFPTAYELSKLSVYILAMAHFWGCGFHLVGEYSKESGQFQRDDNWIAKSQLQEEDWVVRYINSIYFTTITMITIGYGDIYPKNVYEKVYVCFMTFITCGLFAYCVNSIGTIFAEIKQKQQVFRQKRYEISNYLKFKGTKKDTYIKILKYIEYLNQESDLIIVKGQQILSECPKELREEVQQEYYSKILLNSILKNYFSPAFLYAMSLKMKEKVLGPGEILVTRGSPLPFLYFIQKGDVEYFFQNKEYQRSLLKLQEAKLIDFKLFASEEQANISIRSKTNTTVAFFSLDDFKETIKLYQADQEKFCYLKDQFINLERNDTQCLSCGQYRHDISSCPQLHFVLGKDLTIQKHCYTVQQQRSQRIKQSKRKKYNALKNFILIREFLRIIRWQKIIEIYPKYQFANIQQEVNILENDKQFFKRSPKIYDVLSLKKQNQQDNDQESQNFFLSLMNDDMNEEDWQRNEDRENQLSEFSEFTDSSSEFTKITSKVSNGDKNKGTQRQINQGIDEIVTDTTLINTYHKNNILHPAVNQLINMIKEEQEQEDSSLPPSNINNNIDDNHNFNSKQPEINIEQIESTIINSQSQCQLNQMSQNISSKNNLMPSFTDKIQNIQTRTCKSKSVSPSSTQHYSIHEQAESGDQETRTPQASMHRSHNSQVNFNQNVKTINKMNSLNSQLNNDTLVSIQNSFIQKPVFDDLSSNYLNQGLNDSKREQGINDDLSQNQSNQYQKQARAFHKNMNMLNTAVQQAISQINRLCNQNTLSYFENNRRKSYYQIDQGKTNLKGKRNSKTNMDLEGNKPNNYDPFQQNGQQTNGASDHIFGSLQFELDKFKEFTIYHPKGNLSNVVRVFKKIQCKNINYQKFQRKKNLQKEFSASTLLSFQDYWKTPTSKIKLNIQLQQQQSSNLTKISANNNK